MQTNILDEDFSEIIVEDKDIEEKALVSEIGDEVRQYPFGDPTKVDVDIREDKMSIYQYMRDYDRQRLQIDPDYQRNLVWKPAQMSRFIESILLGFPLPPFYVNQTIENKLVIIDGLQRTTTLHKFVNDEFTLKELKTLPDINNKKFSELPESYRAKIEDKNIQLYILKPSTPIEVVYELFDRINTGGTPLNRQEVRNCIYLGKSTQLLSELSKEPYFRQAIDNGVSPTRMKDREVVLRYLAFKIFDYEKDYQGDLSEFLEKAMQRINKMGEEEIEIHKQDFKRVMKLTYEFFGKRNFRFPVLDKEGNIQSRGFINTSMFESVAYFFSSCTDEFLSTYREKIQENFEKLLKNPIYIDAVRFSTGSKFRVIHRFQLAKEILGKI
ncbi:MAG: DUF262 domain-containing protein [Microscillaceae bacterium]|nr:DUF262 domain-containing protein [Microscillaceae bacterium]